MTTLYTHDEYIRPVVAECLIKYFNLDIEIIDITDDVDKFLSNFPVRTVPGLLFEDGTILFEQMAVVNYIIYKSMNTHEINQLLVKDEYPLVKSETIMFCSFCTSDFFNTLVTYCLTDIKSIPITKEETLNASKTLDAMFPIFENKLSKHKFLTGNHITIADLIAAASFSKGFISMLDHKWRMKHPLIDNWFREVIGSKYMAYRFENFKFVENAHKLSHRMLPWF